jgi:adenine phosphoribosyltransferase
MSVTVVPAFTARQVARVGVSDTVRSVRVVHSLDGIDRDVSGEDVLAAGQALWQRWLRHPAYRDHDVILGLDAGGILPTVAVSMASATPYRLAWKLHLDLPGKVRFEEPHARRVDVFAYGDFTGRRVLIVDDEVTTGRTAVNLVAALRGVAADVIGMLCLVEDGAAGCRGVLEQHAVPLCSLTTL